MLWVPNKPLFIFTFILIKLEFGFYKSHVYGLFSPVKNTFPNRYNWINTNNESNHYKIFPRKAAAPRSTKVESDILQILEKSVKVKWKTTSNNKEVNETFISLYILLDPQKYSINYMDMLQASRTSF